MIFVLPSNAPTLLWSHLSQGHLAPCCLTAAIYCDAEYSCYYSLAAVNLYLATNHLCINMDFVMLHTNGCNIVLHIIWTVQPPRGWISENEFYFRKSKETHTLHDRNLVVISLISRPLLRGKVCFKLKGTAVWFYDAEHYWMFHFWTVLGLASI